jgi:hypothetical protein
LRIASFYVLLSITQCRFAYWVGSANRTINAAHLGLSSEKPQWNVQRIGCPDKQLALDKNICWGLPENMGIAVAAIVYGIPGDYHRSASALPLLKLANQGLNGHNFPFVLDTECEPIASLLQHRMIKWSFYLTGVPARL